MAVSAKPSRRSLWARLRLFWLEILIFSLLCLPLLLVGLAASDAGTRWLLQAGERLSGGAVQFKVVSGSLLGHLKINEVQLHSQAAQLRIAGLALDWQAQRLFAGELAIDRLYLGHIDLHMPDSQTPPSKPASLRLPLAVALSDVRVDGLSLNGRKLLDQLAFTVSSDGDYHRLQGLTLATPWFSGRGELRLDGRAPFQLGGSVNLQASHAEASWQMAALLGNRLDDLSLTGQGSGAPAGMAPFRLGFDLRLDPFAASPYGLVKSGRFDSHAVDLHSFAASLPHSALDIELRAQPQGEQVAAQLALVNRLPGSWPDQRLPLAQLDARLRLSSHTAQIDALTASKGGARISVSGQLSRQAMALSAKLADVPLADYGGPALPLSGELRMTGAPSLPQLQGRLRSAKLLADIDGGLQVQGGQHWLLAKTLRLAAAGGELALNGRLALGSGRAFSLEGQYQHFDPASLAGLLGYPLASGELNGRMTLSGALQPAARASVVLALRDSRFNGQTLSGDASGTLVQGRLSAVAMNLALGSNRLKASGDFGKPGDSLALDFALPSIADLGNGFAGRLEARLRLSGTLHRPSIDGSARADQLRLPGGVAVNHAQLQAKIDAVAAQALDAPFALKLDVQGMAASRLQLASAHIDLQGQRAAHRGTLSGQGSVAGRGFDFAATANGALDEHGWRGWIERLENSGDLPLRMQGPARVQLGLGHASIDEMQLLALGSQLRINHADWQGARFAVVGDIRDVALADWLARFPELAPRVNTDLVLGGRFDLHGDQGLGGSLTLERQRGDISLLVDDPLVKPMPLRLSAAKAALELAGDTAALSLDLQSASFGYARGRFASRFVRGATGWQPAPGAALQGSLHAEMPALDWVGPLLGPTAAVSGRLSADLTADGALGKPSWYGRLKLDDFGLRLPELGTQWHDGKLEAVLQGETAQLTALSLQGGRGEASASGRLSLREAGPEGALTVRFRQFGALT
ncbi:hypothetical protein, partial [Chitinimonas sp.]|uniref:translocation/assembly module TamB domain-containing protein n=1 Tax=Chitinimonas sp. TaxID=1934313 RepID=UPI0035B10841